MRVRRRRTRLRRRALGAPRWLGRRRESLIGFAGGPFTLASYIVAGGSSRHDEIRQFRARHPEAFRALLDVIADAVLDSLQYQIDNGADVVQLFDTYAGELPPADYREFLQPLHRRICAGVDAPVILFVRNMAGRLDALADADPDAVSLDWTVDIADARDELGDVAVQGNLDPQYLFGDESFVRRETEKVIETAGRAARAQPRARRPRGDPGGERPDVRRNREELGVLGP
nr:uroporphyrinogen decarboxylase family protein [Halarchaeum acidiphilum]